MEERPVRGRRRRAPPTGSRGVLRWYAAGVLLLAGVGGAGADASRSTCFDLSGAVTEPLRPAIALLEGSDNTAFATSPRDRLGGGTAVIRQPTEAVYVKVLDHHNVQNMLKTKLDTQVLECPDLLEYPILVNREVRP